MSKEEETILWHCVARIPEFIAAAGVVLSRTSIHRGVAEALELSEDAVKQRLARGRKLLQDRRWPTWRARCKARKPDPRLHFGVLAALPLSATSAVALTVGAAVKGSSTAKTVASLGAAGAILLYWSLLGFLAFVGGCAGYWMRRACARSSRQCEMSSGSGALWPWASRCVLSLADGCFFRICRRSGWVSCGSYGSYAWICFTSSLWLPWQYGCGAGGVNSPSRKPTRRKPQRNC